MDDIVNDDTPDESLKPTMPHMVARLLKASIDKRERRITELEAMLKMKQDDWLEVCQEVDALKKKYNELEADLDVLLLRLAGEDSETCAPETLKVLDKYHGRIQELLTQY